MKLKNNIIAVVAARGGSKGIPEKNIKELNGKPLVYYILNTLSKIRLIDRIILSTDSKKIKEIVKKLKLKRIEIFDRPKKLSGDTVPLTTVAKYVAEMLELKRTNSKYRFTGISSLSFFKKIDNNKINKYFKEKEKKY